MLGTPGGVHLESPQQGPEFWVLSIQELQRMFHRFQERREVWGEIFAFRHVETELLEVEEQIHPVSFLRSEFGRTNGVSSQHKEELRAPLGLGFGWKGVSTFGGYDGGEFPQWGGCCPPLSEPLIHPCQRNLGVLTLKRDERNGEACLACLLWSR